MKITFDPIKRNATLENRVWILPMRSVCLRGPLSNKRMIGSIMASAVTLPLDFCEAGWLSSSGHRVVMPAILFRCERPMNVSKSVTKTDWIDPDDAPELTDAWFDTADIKINGKTVKRGRPAGSNKRQVAIRLDVDIIERFKADGAGWQSRVNAVLKDWISRH